MENKGRGAMRTVFLFSLAVILLCCLLMFLCFGSFALLGSAGTAAEIERSADGQKEYRTVYGNSSENDKFLSIVIAAPILNDISLDGGGGLFGGGYVYGYDVKEQLRRAAEDDSIDGVILEINSPGGTITGSKAISDGVAYYKEQTDKPVIAHISGIGASGAYWSAASTDEILVDAGSLTGSIGVIYGPVKYYDGVTEEGSILGKVVTQNGIETSYFTAGTYKDNGSPYRRMTDEEIKLIQEGIDNEYDNFVEYVSERRGISESSIRNDVKALAYGNDQAIELKLADKEATREEAYAELASKAGVEGDFRVVRESDPLGFLGMLFSSMGADKYFGTETQQSAANDDLSATCVLCDKPLYFYGDPTAIEAQ